MTYNKNQHTQNHSSCSFYEAVWAAVHEWGRGQAIREGKEGAPTPACENTKSS